MDRGADSRTSRQAAGEGLPRPTPSEPVLDAIRSKTLLDLLDELLDLPEAARATLLSETARQDLALVQEARRVLAADARADDFLQPPVQASIGAADRVSAEDPPPCLPTGTRIAGYRLLDLIASGGMGSVHVALQESTGRRVALKVLDAGSLSAQQRQRFEVESRILAHLEHPAIARVFDAGVWAEGGVLLPWFAMELVEDARPLDEHARAAELSLRERAELMAGVCDAVHHGHIKGIVHRDLKPANILVDRSGHPRVIDFGVARTVGGELQANPPRTVSGQIVGTLPWMSPEHLQAEPEAVDARSDVYSLGVVLYELMVGQAPYDFGTGSLVDVSVAIQEQPPRRPSAIRPDLRGGLENLLLKALEKDPARRYASAAALADDLRRWLAYRPVEAAAAGAWHHVALYARRHRALVASALFALTITLVAASVSIGWALRAERAETRSSKLFSTLLDSSLDATFDFSLRAGRLSGGTALSREMVAAALDDLALLSAQAGDDPELAARIGFARLRLGDVLGNPAGPNLGDTAAAGALFEQALVAGLVLAEQHPELLECLRLPAYAHRRLGELGFHGGSADHGLSSLRASLAGFEAAAVRHPASALLRLDCSYTHDKLASAQGRARDHTEAERHAQLAIEGFEQALAAGLLSPQETALAVEGVRLNVAGLRFLAGRYEEALAAYRSTLVALVPLVALQPQDVPLRDKLAWARMWVGTTLSSLQRNGEAAVELAAALAEYRALASLDPIDVNPPVRVAHIAFTLAQIEREAGAPDAARAWYQQALEALAPLETSGRLVGTLAALPSRVRAELASLPTKVTSSSPSTGS